MPTSSATLFDGWSLDRPHRQPGRPLAEGDDRRAAYADSVNLLGPAQPTPASAVAVRFERTLNGHARRATTALVVLNAALSAAFLGWVTSRVGSLPGRLVVVPFAILVTVEVLRLIQNVSLWLYALMARDPVPMEPPSGMRVAMLTTIVPSREPIDVLERTLAAMTGVRHNGALDVWVLDEGDDPDVRGVASSLGVQHFTRKGCPHYNQPSGSYRVRTKAGNYNAWRAEHEEAYDVVIQMDPDHVPHPEFLGRTLGYFRDPDVAFVVGPQVYGNADDGFVARAAATQMYPFQAVVQRGGNGLGAPMLIGTNHLYRVSAWRQIGGYQDSIIEDHLTGLRVQTEANPRTGRPWKGVYTPDVIAVGDAPATWTDYFNQQKRWSRGVWEIVCRHSPTLLRRLRPSQVVAYAALQLYYPTQGIVWLLGNLLLGLYLTTGMTALPTEASWFLPLWALMNVAQFAMFLWLRRYNLAAHERREVPWRAIVISAVVAPVYAAAAVGFLLRRPLGFVVTAKGALVRGDSLGTFKYHLVWMTLLTTLLAVGVVRGFTGGSFLGWAGVAAFAAFLPVLLRPHPVLSGAGCDDPGV